MRVAKTEHYATAEGAENLLLHLEMTQRYRHPVGWAQPFYAGLLEQVLRATRCSECRSSWCPPRRFCPADLTETSWYDLPGTGTVLAATRVHTPPPFGGIEPPYILASIRLDEVDTGITHRVLGSDPPEHGTEVTATFHNNPSAHPLLGFAFAMKGAQS